MKKFLKFALLGLGCYALPLTLFYGFHKYSFPLFLVLIGLVSYFSLRKENEKAVGKGLLQFNLPLLALLSVTAYFTDNQRLILPYLIFTPLVAICVYYWINSKQKLVFPAMILVFAVIGLVSFDVISGSDAVFDSSYLQLFRSVVTK